MGASATRAATDEKLALVARESAGRSVPPELQVYVHVAAVGTRDQGLARAAASFGTSPEAAAASPHVLAGGVDDVVETLERRRAELGISYVSIPADAVDAFAPVVARLGGK
jgi:hypothetical protein